MTSLSVESHYWRHCKQVRFNTSFKNELDFLRSVLLATGITREVRQCKKLSRRSFVAIVERRSYCFALIEELTAKWCQTMELVWIKDFKRCIPRCSVVLFRDTTSLLVLALSASLRPKYGTPYLFTSANLKLTLPSDVILRRTTFCQPIRRTTFCQPILPP